MGLAVVLLLHPDSVVRLVGDLQTKEIRKQLGLVQDVAEETRASFDPNRILTDPPPESRVVAAVEGEREPRGRVRAMPREADGRDVGSGRDRAPPPGVERVARQQGARRVRHLTHAAEMIGREEPRSAVDLFTQPEGPPRHGHAVGRALLADGRLAPEHARVGGRDAVLLLDLPHAPLQAVVDKLTALRPDGDGDELIAGIPLECS